MATKKRILVVEDDSDVRDALVDALEIGGYEVATAANGELALGYLRHLRSVEMPNLILLDLMMPVMNGQQFCAEQQKDPALATLPVIVFTADGRPEQKTAALKIVGVMQKPIDLDELLETVRRFC